jgi:hypothetical protein
MKWIQKNRIVLLIFLVGLSSCMPTFKYPIGELDTTTEYENLLGIWYDPSLDEPEQYAFVAIFRKKNGFLRVIYTDEESGVLDLQAHVVRLNEETYLNFQPVGYVENEEKVADFFCIVLFDFNIRGELEIYHFANDSLKAAIERGELRGKIIPQKINSFEIFDEIEIVSTTKELRNYLKAHDKEEYLDEPSIWRKMKK